MTYLICGRRGKPCGYHRHPKYSPAHNAPERPIASTVQRSPSASPNSDKRPIPKPSDQMHNQCQRRHRRKDLQDLKGMLWPDMSLDVPGTMDLLLHAGALVHLYVINALVGREAAVLGVVLQKGILFLPAFGEPMVEFFGVLWNFRSGKATPVHVHRWTGAALEVDSSDCEDILTILTAAVLALAC